METVLERVFVDKHEDSIYSSIPSNDEEEKMPNVIHGWLQMKVMTMLVQRLPKEYGVYPPITFKTTERGYTPDVCVYSKNSLHFDLLDVNPNANIAPTLAVEIVSSSQNNVELILKAISMIQAGVETCWIVEPATGVVVVCTQDGRTTLHKGEFLHHPLLSDPISLDELFDTSL